MSVFYKKDALSVWKNLGKHFEVRLVMRLNYKDGHKTHYASRTNYLGSSLNIVASNQSRSWRAKLLVPYKENVKEIQRLNCYATNL